jgi:hypothetical protein
VSSSGFRVSGWGLCTVIMSVSPTSAAERNDTLRSTCQGTHEGSDTALAHTGFRDVIGTPQNSNCSVGGIQAKVVWSDNSSKLR